MKSALSIGLRLPDLDELDYGVVVDMITEAANDFEEWTPLASQADIDRL